MTPRMLEFRKSLPGIQASDRIVGIVLVLVAAIGYGSGPLLAKSAYASGADWITLLSWRFGLGALMTWVWVVGRAGDRRVLRELGLRRAMTLLAVGAFFGAQASTYYASLETVPASLAALIVFTYPVLVALASTRFGLAPSGRGAWVALAIVSVGVVLTLGGIQGSVAPVGLALACVTPILSASYVILVAHFAGERRGAAAIDRLRPGAITSPAVVAAVMLTGTTLVMAWIAIVSGHTDPRPGLSAGVWASVVGIATLSTALAIQVFYAGITRIGAASASAVSTMEPVFTVAMAALLFGERLSSEQVVGGILVVVGVAVVGTTQRPVVVAIREEV